LIWLRFLPDLEAMSSDDFGPRPSDDSVGQSPGLYDTMHSARRASRATLKRRNSSIRKVAAGGDVQEISQNLMTEFLLEASEVETRLRQHVAELIEPTIKKQGTLEGRIKDVKAYSAMVRADVDDLLSTRGTSESMSHTIECFRVELAGWDKERHEQEFRVGNRLSAQEVEINSLRQSLELLKGADSSNINRTLQNVGDLLTKYKDENTDLRRFCTERMDLNRDKVSKLRDEFETRTLAMESQMHRLQDIQTEATTTIGHIDELVKSMDKSVKQSAEGIADLERSKVSVRCLEEQQRDSSEFMLHVNSTVSMLKQQFGSLADDVKAHFETATEVVGRSTATQIQNMRAQYDEDIQRIDVMRNHVDEFASSQKAIVDKLEYDLDTTRETSNVAITDLSEAIEKLRHQRIMDQKNWEIETVQLRKLIREVEAVIEDTPEGSGALVSGRDRLDSRAVDDASDGQGGQHDSSGASPMSRRSAASPPNHAGNEVDHGEGELAYFTRLSRTLITGSSSPESMSKARRPSPSADGGVQHRSAHPSPVPSHATLHGVQHRSAHPKGDALASFIESAWMGLACELQDEKDRKAISLYGFKDGPDIASVSPSSNIGTLPNIMAKNGSTRSGVSASPRHRGSAKSGKDYRVGILESPRHHTSEAAFAEPVVSIDSRCLSCSGSTATVLAGFKMACLRYEPGLIEYEGTTYSRSELVSKRMELLQQARLAIKPQHTAAARTID